MPASELVIGNLKVIITGDTKDVQAAAKRVNDALKDIQKGSQNTDIAVARSLGSMVGRFIGLAIVVRGVQSAIALFQSTMADISAMDKLSQASGVSIEKLSSLRAVAEQNGVEFRTLNQVIGTFGGRMREFVASPTSAGAVALRLMGISARDATGQVKSFESLLPQIADKFASYTDGSNKAALASALFGERAGPELVRLLNQGSKAIADQRQELERSNKVLTQESIQKAREYQKAMSLLSTAVTQLAQDLTITLAPSVIKVTELVTQFLDALRDPLAGKSVAQLEDQLAGLVTRQAKIKSDLDDPGWWGAFSRSGGAKEALAEVDAQIAAITKRVQELKATGWSNVSVTAPQTKATAPDLGEAQKAIALANEQLAMLQQSLSGMPILFQQAFGDTAWTKPFLDAMAKVDAAVLKGAISVQRAQKIKIGLQKQEQDQILNTASLTAQTITAVFAKSKTASVAAALINTAVGVTKALSASPPPFNFINAALVAAAGAAQIASIRSTSEAGGGGVAPVSGGSQAAQADAAPAPQNSTLFVEGISPNAIFTGATMRTFAEQLIEYQKQGGKIVLSPA